MANSINIISKEYLNTEELILVIEKIAKRLSYKAIKSYSEEYDVTEIDLFRENLNNNLNITFSRKSYYDDTFNNLYGINNYGIMISIEYSYEDIMLIPFLKEIMSEIPNILIYNEETPKGIDSIIFNKSQVLNFPQKDAYKLLNTPSI
ncbi:hypothetical protein FLACOL_01166 [Flavobacterium columnare]|uniref:IPExxxVDY family protein n=2 Tax=Flavobacterium TaxID=237 RepID=A0ABW8PKG4_9FLAO|nr:hypothetical protein [Flavobacterium columnare]SPE77174.1 hypothetical protein FLACOL_01166 [Flavobacterium columnare]